MFQHLIAGVLAHAFARLVDGVPHRSRPLKTALLTLSVGIALGLLPVALSAAEGLADGNSVRIRSSSMEAGWHLGRAKLDDRRCWMVQLDKPTEHGYTMVALKVVDALQVGSTGDWKATNVKQVVGATPTHCLADDAD